MYFDTGEIINRAYIAGQGLQWTEWCSLNNHNDVSNPNLLVNPDFYVNQRRESTYGASTISKFGLWCMDMWKFNTENSAKCTTVTASTGNGIKIELVDGTINDAVLLQIVDRGNSSCYNGSTLTFSAYVSDLHAKGAYLSIGYKTNSGWTYANTKITSVGVSSVTAVMPTTGIIGIVVFIRAANIQDGDADGSSISINWTKLEMGTTIRHTHQHNILKTC